LLPSGHAESIEAPTVFGGFGPKTLRLQSADQVNHNTKRLVFEFPDQNAKSGLTLTCEFLLAAAHYFITLLTPR
jgi:cytochrome-b5 reductase